MILMGPFPPAKLSGMGSATLQGTVIDAKHGLRISKPWSRKHPEARSENKTLR